MYFQPVSFRLQWFIELSSYCKPKYICILSVNFGGIDGIQCPLTTTMTYFQDFVTFNRSPIPRKLWCPSLPSLSLSVFMNLFAHDSLSAWNHMSCTFCAQLFSLTIMCSRFIRCVACASTSFIFYGWMVPQCVGISHVSYLLIDEHLNCFDFFMIVHNAAINIHIHVFV